MSTRIAYYAAGYRDGWLSQNDIRDLEDMNPIDDPAADEYRGRTEATEFHDPKPVTSPQFEEKSRRALPDDERDENEDADAAWRAIRAEAASLRPMLLHTATMLATKEAHERDAAWKRNAENPAALDRWAQGFYPKLRERVVEAFQPAGLALDEIAARHSAADVKPADLDGVARAWAVPDRAGEFGTRRVDERAEALADAVLAALLVPREASRAA